MHATRDGWPTWIKTFYYVCRLSGLYDLAIRRHLPPEIIPLYEAFRQACDALAPAIQESTADDLNP